MSTFDIIVYCVGETFKFLVPMALYAGLVYGAYKMIKKGWF